MIVIVYIVVIFGLVCIILLKLEEFSLSIKMVFTNTIKNDSIYIYICFSLFEL